MALRFFYSFRSVLLEKNIRVCFYYNDGYIKHFIKELNEYAIPDTIVLLPMHQKPASAYDTWIGRDIGVISHRTLTLYYEMQYADMIRYMNLQDCAINCDFYLNEDYLFDIYKTLPDIYKNIDILVINSTPCTNQYTQDSHDIDELARHLKKSYNVVTTKKVDTIPCTLDADFRIRDIAALATHAKYVVAIHTGPLCALHNIQTKNVVKKWFMIVNNNVYYTYKDINYDMITNGNLQGIYTYFNTIKNLEPIRNPETPLLQESEAAHPL
jgi:hypothetical protein